MPKPSIEAPSVALTVAMLGVSSLALGLGAKASYASDTNHAHVFVVGSSSGLANCEWLDAANTSRARTRFPREPALNFQVRLPGGIGEAPVSDAAGNLIVVHGEPRISKLDPRGRTLWSKRLESEATSAPVLTSAGKILIVTHDAEALLFSPLGQLLHQSTLPLGEQRHRTLAIPTANGGALVASGTALVELDGMGELTRETRVPSNATAVAESTAGLLAIGENGVVTLARATGDFEVIGSLGGATPEGAAVQNGKLYAVVDGHKLVAFDLARGSAVTLAGDPAVALNGPPVLLANRGSVVVADGGFLSLHAEGGSETLRVSLAEASRAFDPATRALRPALAIADADGAVAATRSGNDALVLAPDGKAQRLDGTSCLDPFRPTPTTKGLVFACRSGQLFWVSDKAP